MSLAGRFPGLGDGGEVFGCGALSPGTERILSGELPELSTPDGRHCTTDAGRVGGREIGERTVKIAERGDLGGHSLASDRAKPQVLYTDRAGASARASGADGP